MRLFNHARNLAGLCVLALAFLPLAGCVTTSNQLSKDAQFKATDPAGVVVIGLNSVGIDEQYAGGAAYPGFRMLWSKVDKPVQSSWDLLEQATESYFFAEYEIVDKGKKAAPADGAQYTVLRVSPGLYQARTIENAVQTIIDGRIRRMRSFTDMNGWQWLIKVEPGEVIYVGDFFADLSQRPSSNVRYHRNDGPAAQALGLYKGVEPPMVYRLPTMPPQRTPQPGS